ncbi:hypothetical protein LCGC14_1524750 [marine sediment metagenome]|uniref:Uncharacterized protein n=1 Tax=marine sediment metagenome TaxID=412755 RepID=A0A0F9IXQ8_9ZZZZ
MRTRRKIMQNFADPGSKDGEVNQIFRQRILLEVLLDIREILKEAS